MEVEGIRKDNRLLNQMRPVSLKIGVIKSADGSAELALGNTKVLATVHGPVGIKSRHEQIDRTTLKVTVESFNSAPSLKNVAMAQKLEKMIHSVIFDLLHPRSLVSITIQPLSLDGSFLTVAFNAAIAALLDSSFPMIRMAFAGSCLMDTQGTILIDPDYSEESSKSLNQSEHFLVYDPEDLKKSIALEHFGKFNFEAVTKVKSVLIESEILPICEIIKNAIREKIEKLKL